MSNNKDEEFDKYRSLYLKNIETKVFPWESAYYYYMQNMSRIDVLTYEEFQDDLLQKNSEYSTAEEQYQNVTLPIYENLDKYFEPVTLLDKNDKFIKLC